MKTYGDPVLVQDGASAATPGLAFLQDPNTGLFRPGADRIQVVTNGTARWEVDANGHFIPVTDDTFDIGNETHRVRHLFMADEGWIDETNTAVFVSATSVKFVGVDLRSRYVIGTRFSYNDGTVDYAVLAKDATLSGSDTLLTFAGNSDYSVANVALTAQRFSHDPMPNGFPTTFGYAATLVGWSVDPTGTNTYRFQIIGSLLYWSVTQTANGTSNAVGHTATLPSGVTLDANTPSTVSFGRAVDAGTTQEGAVTALASATTMSLHGIGLSLTSTASGNSSFRQGFIVCPLSR